MEQLLKILENNARLPVEDIATMLNKSPAEVAAMMDLARAQGIIKGYKTLVDWEKAKVNRVEAVIELNVSPKKSRGFDEIAATIASFDEGEEDASAEDFDFENLDLDDGLDDIDDLGDE